MRQFTVVEHHGLLQATPLPARLNRLEAIRGSVPLSLSHFFGFNRRSASTVVIPGFDASQSNSVPIISAR